jgi:hypothetical protein
VRLDVREKYKTESLQLCHEQLHDDCFSVATQHRENVATSATIQRGYEHVVTRVATPKDGKITEKTSTNNRAEKATHQIQRNTEKHSPLRFPPSALL